MRLWHEELIPKLPRQQLLGQHREVAALRGLGWGKNHSTVNYVFNYSPYLLYKYHCRVIAEMRKRGYKVDKSWYDPLYRGKISNPYRYDDVIVERYGVLIYPEHNEGYMKECLENLNCKGINIT